mgnify:CR=1 FL=1
MWTVSDFLVQTKFFTLNFVTLLKFCDETQLEKKLIGFTEKYINVKATNENDESKVKIQKAEETAHQQQNQIMLKSPLMQIKQLMRMLSTPLYDGRLLFSFDANKATLKYILLNPNICFEEIASQARSVILAGGTMKPVSIDILSYIFVSKINLLP